MGKSVLSDLSGRKVRRRGWSVALCLTAELLIRPSQVLLVAASLRRNPVDCRPCHETLQNYRMLFAYLLIYPASLFISSSTDDHR